MLSSVSSYMQHEMYEQLQRILAVEVIENKSPWLYPKVGGPKSNVKLRLCFNSRELNAVTKIGTFSFPYI